MTKRIMILFLAIGLFLQGNVILGRESISLEALLKEAIQENPEILMAKKRWEASLARVPQAKSLDNPTIGVGFEKIPKGTIKLDRTMKDDRMLSMSQFIPLFGKLSLKGKIAVVESQMFAAEYKGKELELINNVKNAYYGLFMNYREVELKRESLSLLEGIADAAEARYAVGDITQEEVYKIDSEIATLNNDLLNLEQERLSKETRLNTLLNRDPEAILGVPDLDEDVSFKEDVKSLYQSTLLNQPELITFSYAIEKNKYAKRLAKKGYFPDLMAQLTLRGITSGTIGPWDLMLGFTLPLWFWTKQRYEVKEAIANLEEAEAAYRAMQNKAFSEVKDLFTRIEIAKNKINLYRDIQIPLLESSIASSISSYRSGRGNIMMLLDSERMLIEARMDYYRALVEYNMNVADLERATGVVLTEEVKL